MDAISIPFLLPQQDECPEWFPLFWAVVAFENPFDVLCDGNKVPPVRVISDDMAFIRIKTMPCC